ncbi:CLC10 protein, partial [Polypterus senegalus]
MNNKDLLEAQATLQSQCERTNSDLQSECDTNCNDLQESRDTLQSQYVTLKEKHDKVTKEFSNMKEYYCDATNTSPDFIKLNHKEQELEELRNTIYNLTSNSGDLLEVQTTPQSQCERNNSNLQEILDNVKSESERNYTELQKRLDDCSLNYSEFQKSHDMLKSECDTNYSNLQERLVKVNSEYATNYSDLQSQCTTLNEKHDEVSKEFSDLKEFYCDTKNMSPENTCSVCKMGWVFFSSKCYFFSPNRKTWNNSHDWCLTKGGRLTIIESLEERTSSTIFDLAVAAAAAALIFSVMSGQSFEWILAKINALCLVHAIEN